MPAPAETNAYDLLVLGAGATGLGAARAAAGKGRRIGLAEPARPGGDCTHYGCVPSKAMLEVARRVHGARDGARYGFHAEPVVDAAAVFERIAATIGVIEQDESPTVLRRQGIELIRGRARFTGPHDLTVTSDDGAPRRVRAERVVIATGAGPLVPGIDGLDRTPYLTNRTVFDLRELPSRLLVLGGGPIGCELAQAFRRLGSDVVLIEGTDRLLGKDEPEAGKVLHTVLSREGIELRLGQPVTAAAAVPPGVSLTLGDGATVEGSHLLVAVGRAADTTDLGLDTVGIGVDERTGRVRTDDHLRTALAHVYAAGDCTSALQFTHVGDEQGRLAAGNAFAKLRGQAFSAAVIPWATFTEPEVGHVGMTEAQAYAAYGEAAKVAYVAYATQDRARCAGETEGFVKLIAAPRSRVLSSKYLAKVVGMTAVCPVGGELVAEAALAMRTGMLAARLAQTVHAYPTWSLTVRLAAAQLFGTFGGKTARAARPDR